MTDNNSHSAEPINVPFQEEVMVERFFAGANRDILLQKSIHALRAGTPVVILSGEEGSGKTMLCRKIEQQAEGFSRVVYFPSTIESFEDVVRLLIDKLPGTQSLSSQPIGLDESVQIIAGELTRTSESLLVIFDEAENIYLATLERIRKLTDQLLILGAKIQVVFSGRVSFLENCEQLSICDFQNSEEVVLRLEPLDLEETGAYLKTSVQHLPDVDGELLFDEQVVANIYELTAGNFRAINILGEQSLETIGEDNSFMVLLDSVQGEDGVEKQSFSFSALWETFKNYKSYLPSHKKSIDYLPWAGGVAFCLLFLLYFSNSDEYNEIPEVGGSTQVTMDNQPSVGSGVDEEKIVFIKSSDLPVQIENTQMSLDDTSTQPEQPVESIIQTAGLDSDAINKNDVGSKQNLTALEKKRDNETFEGKIEGTLKYENNQTVKNIEIKKENQPKKVERKTLPVVERTVVALHPTGKLKRRPGKTQKQVSTGARGKKLLQVQDVIAANAHFTVEQLYGKRVSAGQSWRRGQKNGKYTVQLMVLTSKTAERNLKGMLAQENYRQEAGNFYIFNKGQRAENIFVFYGEYRTIAQARLAQNSLPQFLKSHKPYAISIKGAMAKLSR